MSQMKDHELFCVRPVRQRLFKSFLGHRYAPLFRRVEQPREQFVPVVFDELNHRGRLAGPDHQRPLLFIVPAEKAAGFLGGNQVAHFARGGHADRAGLRARLRRHLVLAQGCQWC